uniref:Slc21a-3 n=1 Tax=Schmidtea mediterranea TaxID=79327 RepID=A0A0H3YK92_SCHMD|nr:slc21a-3 [Schmidtea mediterranea]
MFTDNVAHLHFKPRNSLNPRISRINPFQDDSIEEYPSLGLTRTLSNSLLVEDHFNEPLPILNISSSIEELTNAIKECKQKIFKLMDNEEAKNRYILYLVELNQTLHTVKEANKIQNKPETIEFIQRSPDIDTKPINITGHQLKKCRKGIGKRKYCEICQGPIRTGTSVYNCLSCIIFAHSSKLCLQRLHRVCPASNLGHPSLFQSQIINNRRYSSANDDLTINIDNFPLSGNLLSQKFLCDECSFPIIPFDSKNSTNLQRSRSVFCNYYRKFYCSSCHWGNTFYIPSVYFILNIWTKLPVCRSAYIKLKFAWNLILFRIPPFWEQNNMNAKEILMIRMKMFRLRPFIRQCSALKNLIRNYDDWLIEQPYLLTMRFVQNISNGSAVKTIQILHSNILDHIPDCENCKTLCSSCSLCTDKQIIYPRTGVSWSCSKCCFSNVHESCGLKNFKTESDFICSNCLKI